MGDKMVKHNQGELPWLLLSSMNQTFFSKTLFKSSPGIVLGPLYEAYFCQGADHDLRRHYSKAVFHSFTLLVAWSGAVRLRLLRYPSYLIDAQDFGAEGCRQFQIQQEPKFASKSNDKWTNEMGQLSSSSRAKNVKQNEWQTRSNTSELYSKVKPLVYDDTIRACAGSLILHISENFSSIA